MTVRKWIKTGIIAAESVQEGKRHRYRIAQQTIDAIQGKQEWTATHGPWLRCYNSQGLWAKKE